MVSIQRVRAQITDDWAHGLSEAHLTRICREAGPRGQRPTAGRAERAFANRGPDARVRCTPTYNRATCGSGIAACARMPT